MAVTDETTKVLKAELARLNKERDQLEETIKKLEDALVSVTRKTGRAARQAVSRKPARRRGARRGGAKKAVASKDWQPTGRAKQALEQIKKSPGITAPEVAKKLKLNNTTAIYPAINKLKANKLIKKDGKGYRAA